MKTDISIKLSSIKSITVNPGEMLVIQSPVQINVNKLAAAIGDVKRKYGLEFPVLVFGPGYLVRKVRKGRKP